LAIITPYIIIRDSVRKLLGHQIWTCPEGYACVRHKKNIFRINNNHTILTEQPSFSEYECEKYSGNLSELKYVSEPASKELDVRALYYEGQTPYQLIKKQVWVCPEGFASIFFRGKVSRISSEFHVKTEFKSFMRAECDLFSGPVSDLRFIDNKKPANTIGFLFERDQTSLPDEQPFVRKNVPSANVIVQNSFKDTSISASERRAEVLEPDTQNSLKVRPFVIQEDTVYQITEREIWVCPNGISGIFFKGKVFQIDSDFHLIFEAESFMRALCSIYQGKTVDLKFFDNRQPKDIRQIQIHNPQTEVTQTLSKPPNHKQLLQLAKLGIDNAFYQLAILERKEVSIAIEFRHRYKNINTIPAENLRVYLKKFTTIDEFLLKLPFKYFLFPIGTGSFGNLYLSLDRSIDNQYVLDILNSKRDIPKELDVPNFINKARATLLFHSEIMKNYENPRMEWDIHEPIFKLQDFINFKNTAAHKFNQSTSNTLDILVMDMNFSHAISRCSSSARFRLGGWKAETFRKIYALCNELPRYLKICDKRVDLLSEDYPDTIKALSIFSLFVLTNNTSLRKKFYVLHEIGIRHIGDIILMSPNIYQLFFRKTMI
jgi:hypothetical protein